MNDTSYHSVAKFFHWAIVTIIAIQFVSGWLMPSMRHSVHPNYYKIIHVSSGLLVLFLAISLLFMRFYKQVAKPEMEKMKLIKNVATGVHYLLYGLLVIVPLSGWIAASIRGKGISFLGIFNVPLLTVNNPSFLYSFGRIHEDLATIIGILILGHLAVALYHHFVLKDPVLRRMLPNRKV